MDQPTREFVMDIIDQAQDLTLATVRPDGYPQATTVSYAHDGLTLFVGVGRDSQKVQNIRQNNKVSLAINTDYHDWNQIKGLSMSGIAEIVSDPEQIRQAEDCMLKRFPQLSEWAATDQAKEMLFLKIEPQMVSVLDYEKGFGHTELVTV